MKKKAKKSTVKKASCPSKGFLHVLCGLDFFQKTISVIALITIIRLVILYTTPMNLFFDEAQYWIWSKTPDFGYYSKPPMVSWWIAVTTLFGDSEFFVRLSSPFLHAASAIAIFFLGKKLFDERVGFWSAVTYATLPAVSLSSILVSTDPSLILFWALSMLFFMEALEKDNIRSWIFAGIAAGLGMLSKYNMLVFLVSAVLYLFFTKRLDVLKNKNFWISIAIAGVIFAPNVMWNFNNGFVSFLHTKDNADLVEKHFNIDKLLEFFFAQFGVFGPILFAALIGIFVGMRKNLQTNEAKFLFCFFAPLFALILSISFFSRAHANWAAPVYVPATIWVVAFLFAKGKEKLIYISIGLHVFVLVLFLLVPSVTKIPGVSFTDGKTNIAQGKIHDPFKRISGWKELGESVSILQKAYPDTVLLTYSRQVFTELKFYVKPTPVVLKWNRLDKISDHFDVTADMRNFNYNEFLFVIDSDVTKKLEQDFAFVEKVGNIEIRPHNEYSIDFYVFHVKDYKGGE